MLSLTQEWIDKAEGDFRTASREARARKAQVEFRYPGELATKEDAHAALQAVKIVRTFVRSKLGLSSALGESMEIVKDPKQVERLAEERKDENWDFRAWIKGHGPDEDELNDLVQELTEQVWSQIDCTECANCCRVTSTRVVPDEFAPLAGALGRSIEDLKAIVLRFETEGEKGWELPSPCPLLEGNLCRVYDDRPQECRDYPNLRTDFRSHSISRFTNAEICPIVLNVIEALKFELRWPGLRRWRGRSRRRR